MNWLRENWFWIAVAVFFFWMHAKMHSGHGGHGTHGGGHGGHGGHEDEAGPNESTARNREHQHAQH